MKILFFDDRGHTYRGGQQALVSVLQTAVGQGHEAHLLTFAHGPLAAAATQAGAHVHVRSLPTQLDQYEGRFRTASRRELVAAAWQSVTLGVAMYREIRRLGIEAVYLSALRPTVYLWPLVFSRRSSLWFAQGNANLGPLSRAASLVPRRLAAVSVASRSCFGLVDVAALDVPTVSIGIDTTAIGLRADTPAHDPLRVLCVGEVSEAKGQLRLADACQTVVRELDTAVQLTLVGGAHTPAARRYLEEIFIAAPDVKVVDVGWQSDLSGIYREHDLLALTSTAEGTPRVFVEAMAAGLPVMSTMVGGIEEFMAGRPGVSLVPDRASARELAEALVGAARYRDREAIVAAASNCSPEEMSRRLLDLLLDGKDRQPALVDRLVAHGRDARNRKGPR